LNQVGTAPCAVRAAFSGAVEQTEAVSDRCMRAVMPQRGIPAAQTGHHLNFDAIFAG